MGQDNFGMVTNDNRKRAKPLTLGLIIGAGLCLLAIGVLAAWVLVANLKPTPATEMSKADQEKLCFNPDLAPTALAQTFRKVILRFGACYEDVIPDGELRYQLPEYGFFVTIPSAYTLRAAQTEGVSGQIEQAFKDEGFAVTRYTAEEYPSGEELVNFASGDTVCDYWAKEDGYYTIDCAEKAGLAEASTQLKLFHELQPAKIYQKLETTSVQTDNRVYENAILYNNGNDYQVFFARGGNWEFVLSDTSRVKNLINCPPNGRAFFDKMWVISAKESGAYCTTDTGEVMDLNDFWDKFRR
ncbi:MAG: hypothetical protein LBQ02_00680 [Candidatus Nomurabacteria bacterium]|jgi:hypothetical protein|nr:hypothetical protein [Candidatus Nomurabacteria bacterium]